MSLDSRVAYSSPMNPVPLPPQGETRSMERKNRESYISCTIPQFSPLGGERSEPITRMRIMPYGTESKSRNVDFISIALRAIHNPRPERPSNLRTLRPIGPVNLKNPFSTTLFPQPFSTTLLHNPPPTGGHNPRGLFPALDCLTFCVIINTSNKLNI